MSFSLRAGAGADYALVTAADGGRWLARRGEPLLPLGAMKLAGAHNAANALAALALAEALSLPLPAMLEELRSFAGLPHRSQWVADVRGVHYVDDSKGTNVGATLAAVQGMQGPLLVILGGDGKGQDFLPLRAAFAAKVRAALLIGRDAPALAQALAGICECRFADSLEDAVAIAAGMAQSGDTVLLSPACASLDMFRDYATAAAYSSPRCAGSPHEHRHHGHAAGAGTQPRSGAGPAHGHPGLEHRAAGADHGDLGVDHHRRT